MMLALSLIAITVAFVAGLVRGVFSCVALYSSNLANGAWRIEVFVQADHIALRATARFKGGTDTSFGVNLPAAEVDRLMATWCEKSGAAERLTQKQETH